MGRRSIGFLGLYPWTTSKGLRLIDRSAELFLPLVVLVSRWLGYSRNSGLSLSVPSSRNKSLGTVFCSLSWCFGSLCLRSRCSSRQFLSRGAVCPSRVVTPTSIDSLHSSVFFLVHSFVSGSIYFLWIPHLCVKFTGTNYSTWAFQFELFLKGKALWGHIDGTDVANTSTSDTSQDVGSSPSWAVLDARIMSWLLGSVEPHIVTNLRPHSSAQSMWAYLKTVYHQDNDARRFQLEHAIAMFQHGSLSIQDYYSAFLTLWNEYADLVIADVPVAALSTI
ncbi:hypothetical protein F0562_028281 [Nyssa sinensis]|uniref:Retrotransposon Copia-like N-terminal domain-containing protein n=1 Tax=Nyssa sinensis TaxID=561372 RepID=A0A5J5B607_9ASTE|nr:hypothetical protein F0562_028281 [Nyssa sinensis]